MRKLSIILLTLTVFVLVSCSERSDEYVVPVPETKVDMASLSGAGIQQGRLIVKFKSQPSAADVITRSGTIGIRRMERVFPPAGRFEARTRAAGLDLWYVVEYDETIPATRAAEMLSLFDDVLVIEPVVPVKRNSSATFKPLRLNEDIAQLKNVTSRSNFTDPYLYLQWHYNNTGGLGSYTTAGADIRLFDAWQVATGHPDVIVAVVDGGIDYTHADLSANIWVNETELNGDTEGDDDGNSYKDDIYGYNFVTGKAIEPTLHGTHVAGIVGAVNNNGIGVGGIAGGDGTASSGVRLMSCQIFVDNMEGENAATNYYTAAAIKYGADNGAVISQNSWGFDIGAVSYTPTVIKDAITYFITSAGTDEYGNQDGPMKGGLVIFSASNDNTSVAVYPSFDNNVISVAAMAPDYKKATYSNFGSAVDIIAPGGEVSYDPESAYTGVLSTGGGWDGKHVAKDAYYYMDGTSMSCPHVSGVAALIVSRYGVGSPGFTPDRLKEMLYRSTYDIYGYNPAYQGLLGVGALDAATALAAETTDLEPPVLLKSISNLAFTRIGASDTVALGDYFVPSGNGELTYRVSVSDPDIISFEITDGVLTISSTAYGKTYVTVTATGTNGLEASATFLFSCYSKTVKPNNGKSGLWIHVGDGTL